MHDGDLRDARRRQPRLVGEAAPAFDEDLALVHQVGAAGLDQVDDRQLVLARDLLRAQRLLQAHRRDGAALDRAVARRDEAAPAGDDADADDGTAAHHRLLAVVVVHVQPGEAAQLEEGRAAVEQARHALARQQLAALLEALALRLRLGDHQLLQPLHLGEPFLHAPRIDAEGSGAGVELRDEGGHQYDAAGAWRGSGKVGSVMRSSVFSDALEVQGHVNVNMLSYQ